MKRDKELVKAILQDIENNDSSCLVANPKIEGYSEEQVNYHIKILEQSGLILISRPATMQSIRSSMVQYAISLTWEGHNYLEELSTNEWVVTG